MALGLGLLLMSCDAPGKSSFEVTPGVRGGVVLVPTQERGQRVLEGLRVFSPGSAEPFDTRVSWVSSPDGAAAVFPLTR
ncbi:MAG: hypothetical protein AB1938_22375 [Myxococcota bacterium]